MKRKPNEGGEIATVKMKYSKLKLGTGRSRRCNFDQFFLLLSGFDEKNRFFRFFGAMYVNFVVDDAVKAQVLQVTDRCLVIVILSPAEQDQPSTLN